MKILVSISNFGDKQLDHLNKIIDEYRSYKKYDVTINVHTTVNINRNDVVSTIYDPNNVGRMVYLHRQEFVDKRNDYDLFIHTENDILIKEDSVDLILKYDKLLPENYVLGLIRYEIHPDDPNIYLPDLWPTVFHRPTKVNNTGNGSYIVHKKIGLKDNYYFILVNMHQSSYLLTKEKLNSVIDKTDFLKKDYQGLETASCGPFAGWDHTDGILYKAWLLNKEELKKCLIHHLSNNHDISRISTWESLIKDLGI